MKKNELMYSIFGRGKGTCADCSHLRKYTANRTYYKCDVYGLSNSEATDWRLKYPACGIINKFTSYEDVYKLAKEEKQEIPEGQISLFELE